MLLAMARFSLLAQVTVCICFNVETWVVLIVDIFLIDHTGKSSLSLANLYRDIELLYLDDHHGKIQTRYLEMSTEPGPQNTVLTFFKTLYSRICGCICTLQIAICDLLFSILLKRYFLQ